MVTKVRMELMSGRDGTEGLATVVLDDRYLIRGMRIHENSLGDFRVDMPAALMPTGETVDVFLPITEEARRELEEAIIASFRMHLHREPSPPAA